MAGKIQDSGQVRNVLASLKGAWRRVAGRRSGDSATETTPRPVELQTSVDEAPTAVPAPAPAVYAVPDATPAETVETGPAEGAVDEEGEQDAPVAEAASESSGEAHTGLSAESAEPAAAEDSTADEAEESRVQAGTAPSGDSSEPASDVETESEPVSEPLEVASEEVAKAVKAPKGRTTAPKQAKDAALEDSARGLSTGPSPFIAPVSAEGGPDSSWTVAQLRVLAKERGVRGYSSMSKAQLLGALNGPQS